MGIVIIGGTGTGKSTLAKLLSLRTGYKLFEIGHVVKFCYLKKMQEEAKQTYNDKEKINESIKKTYRNNSKDYFTVKRLKYVDEMVKKNGNDYFIKRLLHVNQNENIIIVGARTFEEIETVKRYMKYPFFVGLTCNENKLMKRFVAREYKYMNQNKAEKIFAKRRWIENNWGVENVLPSCNITLSTENKKPSELASNILEEYKNFIKVQNRKKGVIGNERKKLIY